MTHALVCGGVRTQAASTRPLPPPYRVALGLVPGKGLG